MSPTLAFLLGALCGAAFAYWDERNPLTWRGRFDWWFKLRCRVFGIHDPWEHYDCVVCEYKGPRFAAYAQRWRDALREMGRDVPDDLMPPKVGP